MTLQDGPDEGHGVGPNPDRLQAPQPRNGADIVRGTMTFVRTAVCAILAITALSAWRSNTDAGAVAITAISTIVGAAIKVAALAHIEDLLDAAERGRVATVRRDAGRTACVDVQRLRHFLVSVCPSRAEVVAEADGWSVFVPGLPVVADGATFDEAIDEMINVLREYADDWQERLLDTPNYRDNWGLVQLIILSDDEQLRGWLVGPGQ